MSKLFALIMAVVLTACSAPQVVNEPAELSAEENKLYIKRLWQRTIGYGASDKYLKLEPLIEGDTGYSIDHQGLLVAWSISSGKVLWQKNYNTSAATAIAKDKKHFYFGTSKGEVFAISKADGQKIWQQRVTSEILSAPVSYAGKLVIRTVDGSVHALSTKDGSKLWSHNRRVPTLSLRGTSRPVVSKGIVISGADSGKLTALALDNGNVLWETTISIPRGRNEIERLIDIDAEPVVVDDVVYTVVYQGRLAALKLDSGRIMWVRDISSYSGMAIDSHRIYISAADGNIWSLDRFNGATLWKQDQLLYRRLSKPTFQGQYLVVGDFNGYLHWIGREDGKMMARTQLGWSVFDEMDFEEYEYVEDERVFSKPRNIIATPVVVGDTAIAITREGLLSAYQVSELD